MYTELMDMQGTVDITSFSIGASKSLLSEVVSEVSVIQIWHYRKRVERTHENFYFTLTKQSLCYLLL